MNTPRGPWGGYDLAAALVAVSPTKHCRAGVHDWVEGPTCEACSQTTEVTR